MRFVSPLFGLALLSLSAAALAAPPLVLPTGPVVGGQSVPVWVVAIDDSGTPIEGLRLRGTASIGSIADWRDMGDGLYAATYTGPAVAERTSVRVEFRGRGSDRESISIERTLELQPSVGVEPSLSISPDSLVLGDDESATLTMVLPATAQPSISASFGSVEGLTPLDNGEWTARYVPRDVNFPHVAVLSLVDERGEGVHAVSIPLLGKVQFPVAAPEGANVLLRIGGREFGPVTSQADGTALVPILVPPGVSIATQVVTVDGQVTESALDLAIPPSRRVQLLPLPSSVPAGSTVTIYAAVVEPTGEMDAVTLPEITATAGEVGAVRRVSPGIVAADWAVAMPDGGTASVLVTLPGESEQVHAVDVDVLAARPMSIELVHDPVEGRSELPIEVIIRDADDVAASGYTAYLMGAETTPITDGGRGSYRANASLSPAHRDQLVVVSSTPTGLPPASLALSSARQTVAPNGALAVAVVALDRYGIPVPGVVVELEVVEGGGRIERTLATGEAGVAMARYRSPDAISAVRIVAKAGAMR